jgi:DNA-binding FrmR family transcriptional regulator
MRIILPRGSGTAMPNGNHPAIVKRLKRAHGHLHTIIEMIEKDRPCEQVAQQLQAVESAIENAKKALIHDHISHCLGRSLAPGAAGRAAMRAVKSIARYL